jgi:hypothetical protein
VGKGLQVVKIILTDPINELVNNLNLIADGF